MIYFWAIICGALIGFSICAGAARMFKAPEVQGMGAFRTLGEMNASNGDPTSHFSVGLGFLLSSAAAAAGTGALTQDVQHRVLPNWAAAIVAKKTKEKEKMKMIASPSRMGFAGAIIGALVIPLLIGFNTLIPVEIAAIAKGILSPAANWLFKYIMPAIFLLAAIGAGKWQAVYSVFFGTLSQFISGNALPGIVLGILVGSIVSQLGHTTKTLAIILFVLVMFLTIFYFRNMDPKTYALKPGIWDKFIKFKKVL